MADYINNNAGMDWDDAIENDGQEFIILPEGDYNFTVTDFERGRFPGSAKMSACNKATLAKQLEEMRGKKRKLVDPLQYALSIAAEDLTNYVPTFAWEMSPPSEKQVAFLERRGIFADSVRNAGLASLLIDRLQRRQQMGLATPKQIRCLERYGFRQVGTWAFEDASSLISMLAGNSWRVPYGITPALYRP